MVTILSLGVGFILGIAATVVAIIVIADWPEKGKEKKVNQWPQR